jgi:hypothetical protein
MPFTIKTRYGAMKSFKDQADIPKIVEGLIEELETEQFDEPDDEHTQVAVSHGDWAVTVQVSGLMTLDDLSWITGSKKSKPVEPLYIRAKSRSEALEMLLKMARGEVDAVRAARWKPFDKAPVFKRNLFRK